MENLEQIVEMEQSLQKLIDNLFDILRYKDEEYVVYYGAGTENEKLLQERRLLESLSVLGKELDRIQQQSPNDTKLKTVKERLNEYLGLAEFALAAHYFFNKQDEQKSKEYLCKAKKNLPNKVAVDLYYHVTSTYIKHFIKFGAFVKNNNFKEGLVVENTGSVGSFVKDVSGCLIPLIIGIGSICSLLIVLLA